MKYYPSLMAAGMLWLASVAAHAGVAVTVGHNSNDDATPAFKFKNVPSPATNAADAKVKFAVVDGDPDSAGGDVEKLHDGKLPTEQDQPDENFFFNAGTPGGRVQVDLGEVTSLKQVNTYSWHPSTRGPQVYKLYASDGTPAGFNAKPAGGVNPETCGWTLVASVNTKAKDSGEDGGQYGVSIANSDGAIGKYRYLLFDMARTEADDDFGNTFYSEINVITGDAPATPAKAAAQGAITVTVGHNSNDDATPAFKFKNVPSPATNSAATNAKIVIVDGEPDGNAGGVEKLNDGKLPTDQDQPEENFFFNAGTPGGRLQMDLGAAISLKQVNTYSWHPNTRGPQVYKLYASDGTQTGFNAKPAGGVNPETCGWTLVASVNTKAKDGGDDGGQYGVSIAKPDGAIGKYRYLLFDIVRTEADDDNGNTFYSEINVIAADGTGMQTSEADTTQPEALVVTTADGKCDITIKTVQAPELKEWAEKQLAPVLAVWYPKIVELLPSEGFTAPAHFSITLKPMDGVAFTSGTSVTANSTWLDSELKGQAVGSLVHEMVHVVQQFGHHGYGNRAPGWLVEGSADYVRWFKYEPQSHGADAVYFRHARNFSPRYDGSYRISANFLNWVSEHYDPKLVTQLNAAMRDNKYEETLWHDYTGKTLPELGDEWKKDLIAQVASPADATKI